MKIIPLQSLVILVGPTNGGKTTLASKYFTEEEILSPQKIKKEFVGDENRFDLNSFSWNEVIRRANLRMSLGYRTVIDGSHLKQRDRTSSAQIGLNLGVPIFYVVINRPLEEKLTGDAYLDPIIKYQDELFYQNEKQILQGDGLSEVIDARETDFGVVHDLPIENIREELLKQGYNGITVVGDIHGMSESLKLVVEWATTRRHWLLFLGDIVDYGPKSIECIETIYDLVMRGKAGFTIGNHDKKLEKWIRQHRHNDVKINLNESNKVTVNQFLALSDHSRYKLENKFLALIERGRTYWNIGNTYFVHGALSPNVYSIKSKKLFGKDEQMALYGEVYYENDTNYYQRNYEWVDKIPKDKRVVIGHDIKYINVPTSDRGEQGGEIIFLDTGCGKGGSLSSVDLNITNECLIIQNFNVH